MEQFVCFNNESEFGGPRDSSEHTAQRERARAHRTHATHAHERLMAVKSGVGGEAADEAKMMKIAEFFWMAVSR